MRDRRYLQGKTRIVVKIGSSSLTHANTGKISLSKLERFVRQVADLKNSGKEVIVVTSGAVAVGLSALNLEKKPMELEGKQAVAAVGQASLMMLYQKLFREYNHVAGQLLITKDIVENAKRKQNVVNTFKSLLAYGAIPVVNENDTVATEEIEFGDNDTLSAIVATLVEADLLILLSDIDGLYDKNPNLHEDARIISHVDAIDERVEHMASGSNSSVGTGGMITKILAAKIANESGIDMVISHADTDHVLSRIVHGEDLGTLFKAPVLQ
ncbi:glutamate 5-kinase [Anaerotalea alkaliphila]|uniref:Glutamate 5-kinase n=1 Tax=Anaerotalea alkaliphila TaxID=2662126 RepID=A0A7X5HWV8_9FIRM|nr:glutamate 5-kinase [Anaerotalea alkaliphila]NDL68150.1 glutamate 5-kinase [Anaerotalea alkaliphila]